MPIFVKTTPSGTSYETIYSRMDQVKFVEDKSLQKLNWYGLLKITKSLQVF